MLEEDGASVGDAGGEDEDIDHIDANQSISAVQAQLAVVTTRLDQYAATWRYADGRLRELLREGVGAHHPPATRVAEGAPRSA